MSRTDAHAPFHVRIARREVAVIPVHRCPGGECDLPDLVPGWADARSRCYWQFTFTGRYICSCWMCHWHRRPGQRRAVVRAELRAAAREWNAENGTMVGRCEVGASHLPITRDALSV